jgi:hypothetical protein
MAKYAITLSVNFGVAYDFEGAEAQLNESLQELLDDLRFQATFTGGKVEAIGAIKSVSNWEVN